MNHQTTRSMEGVPAHPLEVVGCPTARKMTPGERDASACIRWLLSRLQCLDLEGQPGAFEDAQRLSDEIRVQAQFAIESRVAEEMSHLSPYVPMAMFGEVFEGQLPTLASLLQRRGQ